MGNIVSVSRDGKQKKAYTYDALNRIISEKDIDKEQEICYTYDNNGNILTKSVNGVVTSYAYEEGTDRLTSYGAETIEYDGMGNPKSYRGSELTWEKGRQLTKMSKADKTIQFGYDALGMRISREADGVRTEYIYEGDRLLRQITGSEVMTFIYGSEGIIGFKLGTSKYLYRKNVFGDVEEIYSAEGTLVGKYSYTAFGECEIETDKNGIATKNPIRYRGYYFDEETGFYYLKTRYYDPETGRFITIDDISYLAPDTINGLNLYAYCGNNPVMMVDPDGCAPKWWQWLLFGIGAALVIASVVVLSVATGGAATGLIGAIAVGAAKGALIGAAVGSVVGIAGGAIYAGVTGADLGQSILSGFLIGFGIGAIVGAVIGGMVGANGWYNAKALEFTNVGSKEVVLGRSPTYVEIAKSRGATYFHTTDDVWNATRSLKGVGNRGMWKINKAFLKQQIKSGANFILTAQPSGYFYAKEVAYVIKHAVYMFL